MKRIQYSRDNYSSNSNKLCNHGQMAQVDCKQDISASKSNKKDILLKYNYSILL